MKKKNTKSKKKKKKNNGLDVKTSLWHILNQNSYRKTKQLAGKNSLFLISCLSKFP
jgi:hypothetical protein